MRPALIVIFSCLVLSGCLEQRDAIPRPEQLSVDVRLDSFVVTYLRDDRPVRPLSTVLRYDDDNRLSGIRQSDTRQGARPNYHYTYQYEGTTGRMARVMSTGAMFYEGFHLDSLVYVEGDRLSALYHFDLLPDQRRLSYWISYQYGSDGEVARVDYNHPGSPGAAYSVRYEWSNGDPVRVLSYGADGELRSEAEYVYDDRPNPLSLAGFTVVELFGLGKYGLTSAHNVTQVRTVQYRDGEQTSAEEEYTYEYDPEGLPILQRRAGHQGDILETRYFYGN